MEKQNSKKNTKLEDWKNLISILILLVLRIETCDLIQRQLSNEGEKTLDVKRCNLPEEKKIIQHFNITDSNVHIHQYSIDGSYNAVNSNQDLPNHCQGSKGEISKPKLETLKKRKADEMQTKSGQRQIE